MDHRHFMSHMQPDVLAGLLASDVALWWALIPVQGIALVFLFALEPEATHKTCLIHTQDGYAAFTARWIAKL